MEKIKVVCDGDYSGMRLKKFRTKATIGEMMEIYNKLRDEGKE